MGSYWDVQAYEAQMKAAKAQTAGLTPEAPISFAGMTQLGSGAPSVGFNQAAYAAQQKSATSTKVDNKPPKPPKPPKTPKVTLYSDIYPKEKTYNADGVLTKIARDPNTLNKKGLKKYTSAKLGIKTTYTEPKNTETVVANSNTGRLRSPKRVGFGGKSSLIIKKNN